MRKLSEAEDSSASNSIAKSSKEKPLLLKELFYSISALLTLLYLTIKISIQIVIQYSVTKIQSFKHTILPALLQVADSFQRLRKWTARVNPIFAMVDQYCISLPYQFIASSLPVSTKFVSNNIAGEVILILSDSPADSSVEILVQNCLENSISVVLIRQNKWMMTPYVRWDGKVEVDLDFGQVEHALWLNKFLQDVGNDKAWRNIVWNVKDDVRNEVVYQGFLMVSRILTKLLKPGVGMITTVAKCKVEALPTLGNSLHVPSGGRVEMDLYLINLELKGMQMLKKSAVSNQEEKVSGVTRKVNLNGAHKPAVQNTQSMRSSDVKPTKNLRARKEDDRSFSNALESILNTK